MVATQDIERDDSRTSNTYHLGDSYREHNDKPVDLQISNVRTNLLGTV